MSRNGMLNVLEEHKREMPDGVYRSLIEELGKMKIQESSDPIRYGRFFVSIQERNEFHDDDEDCEVCSSRFTFGKAILITVDAPLILTTSMAESTHFKNYLKNAKNGEWLSTHHFELPHFGGTSDQFINIHGKVTIIK